MKQTPHTRNPVGRTISMSQYDHLLNGVESLTKPDFHALNKHDGRNDRLMHAVLCAYSKHHLDCPEIGWNKLGDILHDVICNEIGDDEYIAWAERVKIYRDGEVNVP